MKQVNEVILPLLGLDAGGEKISEVTARRWLAKLGYELKEAKKGIYVDGHEREDVVTYQQEFLRKFAENERYITKLHEWLSTNKKWQAATYLYRQGT